jgi:aspartate/methionine/tyrosine aminotransferase
MRDLLEYCHDQGIVAIVDEIYQGLSYTKERPFTAAQMTESAWVINSFSKYYCMTGWRLGWMLVPPAYERTVEILSQNLAICAPTIAQKAALAALSARDELQVHVGHYRDNRDRLLATLREAGVTSFAPADGAFYVYADFSELTTDSRRFCREMLKDLAVATTPGIDFDYERGQRMVRFSYCLSPEKLIEACSRLGPYLSTKRREKKEVSL